MKADGANEAPIDPEKRDLQTLVRGIVLAQGNLFVKELLRKKTIRIGATKADFERNMLQAINDGKLLRSDIENWLDEVEGWGDQHVYLFKVPEAIASDALWSSQKSLLQKLKTADLGSLFNAQTSLEYPATRKLTGVYFDGDSLRFMWHQGRGSWLRTPNRDFEKEINADQYQFRAYRFRGERSVMRFELRLGDRLAAVFMQIPWNKAEHDQALQEVRDVISPLVDLDALTEFSASNAIKKLDQEELNQQKVGGAFPPGGSITAHRTRLSDAGAYVEFANTAQGHGYKESEPVRQVRRALKPENFTGTNGMFIYQPSTPKGANREVMIEMLGEERRIRIWAQLTASEVWKILNLLENYG